MTPVEKLAAALEAAETNAARIQARQDETYEAACQVASDALLVAVAQHDEVVAAAETKRAADAATEQGRTRALVERAAQEFDAEMRVLYDAPEVTVVVTQAGSLELRSGRTRLAGAVSQGPAWRVDGPGGASFVPGAAAARAALWSSLDDARVVA